MTQPRMSKERMQSPTAAEIIYRLKIAGKNKFEKELEGEIDSK